MDCILSCRCGPDDEFTPRHREVRRGLYIVIVERPAPVEPSTLQPGLVASEEDIAADVVSALRNAKETGEVLDKQLEDIVGAEGWSEGLAKAILKKLMVMLKDNHATTGQALVDACNLY